MFTRLFKPDQGLLCNGERKMFLKLDFAFLPENRKKNSDSQQKLRKNINKPFFDKRNYPSQKISYF